MTIDQAYRDLLQLTVALYGDREGTSVARIVFEDALGIRNVRRTTPLGHEGAAELRRVAERLRAGEPVQYALGTAHFYGLRLQVDHRVLIPRPETEELVHWILADHPKDRSVRNVLDIGTGSGCIALALKHERPDWKVAGLDASAQALAVAANNAQNLDLDIELIHLDFLDERAWTTLPHFDLIISNPPYIPRREWRLMPEQVRRHEPAEALFVADDAPLIFYQKIARFGCLKGTPGARIYVETNEYNARETVALFHAAGYAELHLERDMQGKERMLRAKM